MCIFSSARFGEEKREGIEGQNRPYLVRLMYVSYLPLYNIGDLKIKAKKTDSAKLGRLKRPGAI